MKATNPSLNDAVRVLQSASKKNESKIWALLAVELRRSKQNRPAVNLSQIARSSEAGETVAVPGKVLGSGSIGGRTVAAFCFSEMAKKKIEGAGGRCLSLEALVDENPKGSGVRIIV